MKRIYLFLLFFLISSAVAFSYELNPGGNPNIWYPNFYMDQQRFQPGIVNNLSLRRLTPFPTGYYAIEVVISSQTSHIVAHQASSTTVYNVSLPTNTIFSKEVNAFGVSTVIVSSETAVKLVATELLYDFVLHNGNDDYVLYISSFAASDYAACFPIPAGGYFSADTIWYPEIWGRFEVGSTTGAIKIMKFYK